VSQNLLATLLPSYALTGPANGENYFSTNPEFGHSYNGLVKLDYALNSRNNLSFHWFAGEGSQTAPVGSSLLPYYEVAPIHVQNYALVLDTVLSPRINNQIQFGVNYFNQIFNDNKKDFDLHATGFLSGSGYPTVAPHLRISGFDAIGVVAPSGRNDIVGQLNDTVSISKGTHDFRFGGEFRQAQIDAFNTGNSTGLFRFTGSIGHWAKDPTVTDNNVKSLADFLAGYVNTSNLATGNPDRQVFINIFDLFAQDTWRLTQRFTLNYGVRYDYEGPPHDPFQNLSIFRPGAGFLFQGAGVGSVYPSDWNNFGPRVGFSWQPSGAGVYYDQPVTSAFFNNHTSNSSPIGLQANPAGPGSFLTQTRSAYTLVAGQQIFPSAAQASCTELQPCGAFTISPNFATLYVVNYNVNVQQSLGSKVIAQIGYVGNESRKLLGTVDINQSHSCPSARRRTTRKSSSSREVVPFSPLTLPWATSTSLARSRPAIMTRSRLLCDWPIFAASPRRSTTPGATRLTRSRCPAPSFRRTARTSKATTATPPWTPATLLPPTSPTPFPTAAAGANDNASGCVTILESARVLQALIGSGRLARPTRTLRFLWGPEVEGTMAFLATHPDTFHAMRADIHMDMVGGDPFKNKSILRVTETP